MALFLKYDMKQKEKLCTLGKALSSPERVEILQLLYRNPLIIGDIAKALDISVSSTIFHVKMLEEAGLITRKSLPNTRGNQKLCTCVTDYVSIELIAPCVEAAETFSIEMPIGSYTSCRVTGSCGLATPTGRVGIWDSQSSFFFPERFHAGLLWSSSGYVEYKIGNGVPASRTAKQLSLSMEICSEAPQHDNNWKSDITLWINNIECATWTCPGDFGDRRGRLTPRWWSNVDTQYGMLVVWKVNHEGTFVNEKKVSDMTIEQLKLRSHSYFTVRIGNKHNAKYVGGFNLFGKTFGDHEQDILLSIEY